MVFVRKLLVALTGALLTLLLLEGAFQLGHEIRRSFISTSKTDELSESPEAGVPLITIAVLGDSTTRPTLNEKGVDISWPAQLERKLNSYVEEKRIAARVEVRNLALAATSSPFQFTRLVDDAKEHPPDLIVTMTGYNDSDRVWEAQRGFLYRNSYLYRWVYWLRTTWLCPSCLSSDLSRPYSPEIPEGPAQDVARLREAMTPLREKMGLTFKNTKAQASLLKEYQDLIAAFKTTSPVSSHDWIQAIAAREVARVFQSLNVESPEVLHEALESSYALFESVKDTILLKDGDTLLNYCLVKASLRARDPDLGSCLPNIRQAIEHGLHLNYAILNVAVQQGAENDPYFVQLFEQLGYNLQLQPNSGHVYYRKLAEFARDHQATWFAMQYPTGNREALKLFFVETPNGQNPFSLSNFYQPPGKLEIAPLFKDVILVGNENFRDVVHDGNRSEYFFDMFALARGLRFGHTTPKGHELIADNALQAIVENWGVVMKALQRRQATP